MKQIPTAEEFLLQRDCIRNVEDFFNDVQPIDLIEFAKLHVEAALRAGYKNKDWSWTNSKDEEVKFELFMKNSYPLRNIK